MDPDETAGPEADTGDAAPEPNRNLSARQFGDLADAMGKTQETFNMHQVGVDLGRNIAGDIGRSFRPGGAGAALVKGLSKLPEAHYDAAGTGADIMSAVNPWA